MKHRVARCWFYSRTYFRLIFRQELFRWTQNKINTCVLSGSRFWDKLRASFLYQLDSTTLHVQLAHYRLSFQYAFFTERRSCICLAGFVVPADFSTTICKNLAMQRGTSRPAIIQDTPRPIGAVGKFF